MNMQNSEMIVVYVTNPDMPTAEKISQLLLEKRLCACTNIYENMQPMFFWPPKTGQISRGNEVVLLIKTFENKFDEIEAEVKKIHPDQIPCIFALKISKVSTNYLNWMRNEMQ